MSFSQPPCHLGGIYDIPVRHRRSVACPVQQGIGAPELLRGADHAVRLLPAARRAAFIGGTQTTLTTAGADSARRGR